MGLLRLKPNLQKFNSQDEEKKKKKKVKLEMHDQQIFKDGDEYYVWIYDPVPLKTFLIGLLLGGWLIEIVFGERDNFMPSRTCSFTWTLHYYLLENL